MSKFQQQIFNNKLGKVVKNLFLECYNATFFFSLLMQALLYSVVCILNWSNRCHPNHNIGASGGFNVFQRNVKGNL